jgi:hypothetical protein
MEARPLALWKSSITNCLSERVCDDQWSASGPRNVGRLAVDVTGWSVKTDDGFAFSLPGWVNPPLAHRLEPGAKVTFFCAMADIVAMLAAGTTDKRLQGEITLGTGNVVTSPFGRLPPDPLSQAPREGGGTGEGRRCAAQPILGYAKVR